MKPRRGIGEVWVIVCVLLAVALIIPAVVLWGNMRSAEREHQDRIDRHKKLETREQELITMVRPTLEPTGLAPAETPGAQMRVPDRAKLAAVEAARFGMEQQAKLYPEEAGASVPPPTPTPAPTGGTPEKPPEGAPPAGGAPGTNPIRIPQETPANPQNPPTPTPGPATTPEAPTAAAAVITQMPHRTLEVMLKDLAIQADRADMIRRRARGEATIHTNTAVYFGGASDMKKSKEDLRDELKAKISEIEAEDAKEQGEGNKRATDLEAQRDTLTKETDDLKAVWEKQRTKIVRDNLKLQNDLEEFKRKEEIKHEVQHVVGQLLKPEREKSRAYINLGRRDRVVPGLKFHVGRRGKYGQLEWKGRIEVREVFDEMSEVQILEVVKPSDPLVEGDLLVNPFFDPKRPVIVVLIGEKHVAGTLSKDDAAARIREIGSIAADDVAVDTDFVVVTARPESDGSKYATALELEVPVAQATDIFRFLRD